MPLAHHGELCSQVLRIRLRTGHTLWLSAASTLCANCKALATADCANGKALATVEMREAHLAGSERNIQKLSVGKRCGSPSPYHG